MDVVVRPETVLQRGFDGAFGLGAYILDVLCDHEVACSFLERITNP